MTAAKMVDLKGNKYEKKNTIFIRAVGFVLPRHSLGTGTKEIELHARRAE
jgi:hypothetical protein